MKNEFNELGLDEAQRLQALVCAYVLGELDEAERAEVETALAQSAELRAEKARFEATIGVVSGALSQAQPASLSKGATSTLDAALARTGSTPWHRRTWVRAAAALAILTGGVALVQFSRTEMEFASALRDSRPAAETEPAATRGAGREKREPALHSLGYSFGESEAPASQPVERNAAPVERDRKGRLKDQEPAAGSAIVEADDDAFFGIDGAFPTGNAEGVTGADIADLEEQEQWTATVVDSLSPDASKEQLDLTARVGLVSGGKPADEAGARDNRGQVELRYVPETKDAAGGERARLSQTTTSLPAPAPAEARGGASKSAPVPNPPAAPSARAPLGTGGGGGGTVPPRRDALGGLGDADIPELSYEKLGEADTRTEVTGGDIGFLDEGGKKTRKGEALRSESGRRALEDSTYSIVEERLVRLRQLEADCRVRPNESPRDMFFRFWGDNPFELTALDRLSTFSADVDTASYALARRYLVDGHLPTKAQIRTEEFVNYFKGDVAPPSEGTFRLQMELAPSLFGDSNDTWMLRVALRGREVAKQERTPLALTFVIDVSGSMREESRLELVKHALRLLVGQMDANDTISIVKFSNDAAVVLPPTSARHRDLIESAIHPLQPEGSTNTESGLRMGYAQASAALTKGAQNRVVLLTDGVANVGITDPNALVAMVESSRRQGVMLNTVGVGMDNHNDNLLEQLADRGDGLCNYVDDEAEVRRALVDNFTGAFQAIARDAKLQVEFDPAQVERYRLLGYENRAVADADFRNAKVDAAEIGAGHQVVALYEIIRTPTRNADGPLAVARVRWKAPYANGIADAESNETESELEARITARDAVGGFAQSTAGYRRSVLVAQFAEFLRRSVHARSDSLDRLIAEAEQLEREMRDPEFGEFVSMVKRSRELVLAELRRRDWIDDCGDLLRHNRFLRHQLDDLHARTGEARDAAEAERVAEALRRELAELEKRVADTEAKLDRATVDRLQAENIELQRRVLELLERLAQKGR